MQYSSLKKLNSPLVQLLINNSGHLQPLFGQRMSCALSISISVDVIVALSYFPLRHQFFKYKLALYLNSTGS